MFKWTEGYSPGDQFFTISKTEYRLKLANNVLFLIHYLKISKNPQSVYYIISFLEDPKVPIKTALPPTKVSPLYLQQQFFQYLKQQMAQMNTMRRSPSPNPVRPPQMNRSMPQNKLPATGGSQRIVPPPTGVTATAALRPPQQGVELPETSLDLFDSFDDYEASIYRVNVLKPVLNRLFEFPAPFKKSKGPNILDDIEADLIAATKRKISSLQERTDAFRKSHYEILEQLKKDRSNFWSLFSELEKENGFDLDELYRKLITADLKDMEQDFEPVYASL